MTESRSTAGGTVIAPDTITQDTLDHALTGDFAPFVGTVHLQADPAARTLPDLSASGKLADVLARFADAHPGGDQRAAASLWTAHLFTGLIAPALAIGAFSGQVLPIDLVGARLRFAAETGLPIAIHVTADTARPLPLAAQVDHLLVACLAPAVALLRVETGLSARLLWENAGGSLFWALATVARQWPERGGEVGEALRALRWPRDACTALTLMRADALAGVAMPRRRVCCLRYALPGFFPCTDICPLVRRNTRATLP